MFGFNWLFRFWNRPEPSSYSPEVQRIVDKYGTDVLELSAKHLLQMIDECLAEARDADQRGDEVGRDAWAMMRRDWVILSESDVYRTAVFRRKFELQREYEFEQMKFAMELRKAHREQLKKQKVRRVALQNEIRRRQVQKSLSEMSPAEIINHLMTTESVSNPHHVTSQNCQL